LVPLSIFTTKAQLISGIKDPFINRHLLAVCCTLSNQKGFAQQSNQLTHKGYYRKAYGKSVGQWIHVPLSYTMFTNWVLKSKNSMKTELGWLICTI